VKVEYDPAKDRDNVAKHKLSLGDFNGFDADPHVTVDDRYDYGETRYRAFGRIDGLGHCLVFTERNAVTRLISFRRAHEKEMALYE
jgi:uncharacterized DUF497 family protein